MDIATNSKFGKNPLRYSSSFNSFESFLLSVFEELLEKKPVLSGDIYSYNIIVLKVYLPWPNKNMLQKNFSLIY